LSIDLIFSDIHGDIEALNTILDISTSKEFQKKFGNIKRVINLGDILGRGTHPVQVINKLKLLQKKYDFISVIGNHDESFLYKKTIAVYPKESIEAHSSLTKKDLEIFQKNSDGSFGLQEFFDKKNNMVFVHGGPLNPTEIIPHDVGIDAWRYNKSWQRITQKNYEFFTPAGYHYKVSSAFSEVKKKLSDFQIICGHQHVEAAYMEDNEGIHEILSTIPHEIERNSNFLLNKKEIKIKTPGNYLIRVGIGGPQGDHPEEHSLPHFGIIQYNPKKVFLFTVKQHANSE